VSHGRCIWETLSRWFRRAAVSCLGHGDPEVSAAIKDQLDAIAFAHTGFFTNQPAEALADLLIANAPGDLDRVYMVSGGSEANEAAIKSARQYHVERGEPQRRHLIARPSKLSRQYPRGAVGWRQRVAP